MNSLCSLVVGSWSFVAFLVLYSAGDAQTTRPPAPAMKAIATVRQLHDALIIPASTVVFGVESQAPKDKAAWLAARDQALVLAESGNLLMLGARARDKGRWMTLSRTLVDRATTVAKALERQSQDDVMMANGDMLSDACENCHTVYRDGGRSMPK